MAKKQRWFASGTQMANEPVHVDGGENPLVKQVYYHYGLDMGGADVAIQPRLFEDFQW